MKRTGLSLAAVTAALLTAAGCSAGPAPITAHGTVTVDYTSSAGGGPGDSLNDGDQVVIVNSSGTVVGNGILATQSFSTTADAPDWEDVFSFKVTVPGALPRYGIQVNGTSHGTVWESAAQMKSGPALSLDETTGL
jgi:hypothetical protein